MNEFIDQTNFPMPQGKCVVYASACVRETEREIMCVCRVCVRVRACVCESGATKSCYIKHFC